MTIYPIPGTPLVLGQEPDGGLLVWGDGGDLFVLQSGKLRFRDYGRPYPNEAWSRIRYQGRTLEIVNPQCKIDLEAVQSGALFLRDGQQPFAGSHELAFMLFFSARYAGGRSEVAACTMDENFEYRLIYADLHQGKLVSRPMYRSGVTLIDDAIYVVDGVRLHKLNKELEPLWAEAETGRIELWMSRTRKTCAHACADTVLYYAGHRTEQADSASPAGQTIDFHWCRDGVLYCLSKADGSLRWQREFPWSVDDYLLHGDRLFVVAGDRLFELNPADGELRHELATGIQVFGWKSGPFGLANLHLEGELLFVLPALEPFILVYRLDELSLLKQLALPQGYCPVEWQRTLADGRMIFSVELMGDEAPEDFHRSALLELHPNHLDQAITMEAGPELDVALRESASEAGKLAIWITLRHAPLDEALRYGELYAQNLAHRHGWHASYKHGATNPSFNGEIHFRIQSPECDAARVEQELKLMESRFKQWNASRDESSPGQFIYAGDGSRRLCTLTARHVQPPASQLTPQASAEPPRPGR